MALTKAEEIELEQLEKERKQAEGSFLGERPGIDDPFLRKLAGGAVTVGQIAAPVAVGAVATPLAGAVTSVATTGLGEYIKSRLIEGEPQEQAIKEAGTGVVIDVALLGTGKVLKPIAKYVGSLGATKGMSKVAKSFAKKNFSKIVKPMSKELDDVAREAIGAVSEEKKTLGRLVGEAKKVARKTGEKVEGKSAKKLVSELLKKEEIIVAPGRVARGESRDVILKKVMKQADKIKDSTDIDDMFNIIDNLDDALVEVYNKEIRGESLTIAEGAAKRIRGVINDHTIKALENTLGKDKASYAKYVGILNDNLGEIRKALKTTRGTYNLMNKAVERGSTDTLKNLMKLDNLLPDNQKFFVNMMNKVARNNLEGISRIYPSIPGVIEKGLELIPRGLSRAVIESERPLTQLGAKALEMTGIGQINK